MSIDGCPAAPTECTDWNREQEPTTTAFDKHRKRRVIYNDDASDARARFTLSVLTTGTDPERRVHLRLNHSLLPEPSADDAWYRVDVPVGALRYVEIDTSYCKSFLHERLGTAMGGPGCLSMFGRQAAQRRFFSDHLMVEYRVRAAAGQWMKRCKEQGMPIYTGRARK